MAADEDFSLRIKRIAETRAAVNDDAPQRQYRPRSSGGGVGGGSGKLVLWVAVGLCAAAGTAFALGSIGSIGTAIGNAVIPEAMRDGAAQDSGGAQRVAAPQASSGWDNLFGSLTGSEGATAAQDPVDFLPPAPDGWFRVTPIDAQTTDVIATLRAQWPQTTSDTAILPLDQNPGFDVLQDFVATRSTPDMEQRALSKTRTYAIYLHPDGSFLNVGLEFQSARSALGDATDPASWIEGLAATTENKLESDEVLERLKLGGIAVINRTKAEGNSPLTGPIGADMDAVKGIHIIAPLTHRAIMEMQGIATPAAAGMLIDAADRDALLVRLE